MFVVGCLLYAVGTGGLVYFLLLRYDLVLGISLGVLLVGYFLMLMR